MTAVAMFAALSGGVDLEDLARRHDFSWTCDSATGTHTVRVKDLTIVLAPGLGTALVNGQPHRLAAPPEIISGRLRVSPDVALMLEERSRRPAEARPAPAARRPVVRLSALKVAIDAGHGGAHTGYVGRTGLMEKDINLDVAVELEKILREWGAEVYMTRRGDKHFAPRVDDDLDERVERVNKATPDLFLSIHTNGADSTSARGFEVFVPKHAAGARDRESREIAQAVRREFGEVWDSPDRGTKDDKNFRVLAGTRCPAALVEMEFVSNPQAERQLASGAVRRKLAEAIADAVRQWAARRK